MKISVIIPAYNAENTIGKCLESIINQTYKNLEIIIVNDGSKDDTLNICQMYSKKDDRIIIIDNVNSGVSHSRNCGIDVSTGDYVTFVDADDYLDLDCFETLIKEEYKDCDFIRYNFKLDGERGFSNNLFDLSDKKLDIDDENLKLLFGHFLTSYEAIPNLVMLLLIKSEVVKKIKFNEKLRMMEDVDFYLQLFLNSKKGVFCNKKLYNYYVNPMSVTHNIDNFKRNILGVIDTNQVIINSYNNNILDSVKPLINSNHLRIISNILIELYFKNKNRYKEVVSEIRKNKDFIRLSNYYQYLPKKNKLFIFFIKHNIVFLELLYLFSLKFVFKLLKKI